MKNVSKVALVMSLAASVLIGCSDEKTADQKKAEQTSKMYNLAAEERNIAEANAKSYWNREWIEAQNQRGQFVSCRPQDSNFNGLVTCTGMRPQPNGTYKETTMYCGYTKEIIGCTNEDKVAN